mmetsp:Transcript_19336/g.23087  ORF Transcript_19336/g.23087 Transcript_19336/m.23087 type:complete len:478 (-) Transcript_19336:490-1923(-)|eukprot:CAMPEP_0197843566 /NCGR_PEP_ID=MMETSP1438-20131217/434_1 /TAXON_ID=1461541 /ORGANISM="Pterosperma sp., Strain CCMP1384" /LENGTH=477 /DNA_ID=CAMNT_0043453773 /DNA_START=501 /DNA_END=1934 /DNA_ORIENTATION=-
MHKYRLVAKKGEGTFSEVLKAQCIKNGKYVAIKCMKNHFDSLDQVNNLREIQALRRLSPHANIIKLLEVLYDQPTGRLALVFELMDMNIYELIRGRRHYVAEDRIKSYMYQLIKSMDHMHRNGIFHRDIKPENVLIMDDCLKLADFGSCRGIYSKQPYTEYISTRWYRAPECLLTDGYYNYKMDMWGVGCVFFEIVSLFPLFPGTNELDQIQKIHNVVGTPPAELLNKMKRRSQHMDFNFPPKEGSGIEKLIPHVSPECVDLITKLLTYNPDDRLSARQALRHPYFRELRDAEKRQQALTSPDLSTSNGVLTLPPATSDSAASTSSHTRKVSDAKGGKQVADMLLPSIGNVKGDQSGEQSQDYSADQSSVANMSQEEGAEDDGGLPPIGVVGPGGKPVLSGMARGGKPGNYHNYLANKGKQQAVMSNRAPLPNPAKGRPVPIGGAPKPNKPGGGGGGGSNNPGKYVSPYSQRYISGK